MHDLSLFFCESWNQILILCMQWLLSVNCDIAIITVKNVNYCCIIYNISKSEAINLLKISVLEDRGYI